MKKTLLIALLALAWYSGNAQTDRAWTSVKEKNFEIAQSASRLSFPTEFKMFRLDADVIRQALATAPTRFAGRASGVVISLPNVDGNFERFEMFEASNFDSALQAQFPQIRSYVGRGIDDKLALLRMSVDPSGIQTMIFRTDKRNEFMEPYAADGSVYAVFHSSRNKANLPFECHTEDSALALNLQQQTGQTSRLSNSGELLTFRLALSCNGEYTAYHGGTVAGALAAMNATMTRVNGVFEKDLAIHMNIIANNNLVVYTNASTDPYTNMGAWNGQLQTTLTNIIGEANYDIGHMFGRTGGGGNAGCIGCVCVDGIKGRGITSPADGIPQGDNFDIDYVAHEMGHQFGGNHTFSNNVEGSGVNVEPGSGSTIMGYAGITAQDIADHSDDYFVYATIKQIQDNMVGKTCPVRTTLTNTAPIMDAGKDYIIPKSTPFILTGSGADANGDAIAYCWEQNDTATTQTGSNSQANATKTGGPNWRSYDPTSSPSRYCPPLERVVANQLVTTFNGIRSEAVSSVARDLNFVLTGRDNLLGVGQTNTDGMTVTVSAVAGPFLVNVPNTNVSWEAGSNQTVTWAVAGTTENGVDAAYVDIYLSTNGGLSFPTLLAGNVPNDGSETISIPNSVGTTNRIMVKGHDHIFYDISNTNFAITAPSATFAVASSSSQSQAICQGASANYAIAYEALAGFNGATSFTVSGQPSGSTVSFSPNPIVNNGIVTVSVDNTTGSTPGFYPITVTATSGAITKTVALYLQLYSSSFAGVSLNAPANAATGVSVTPTLDWTTDANATEYDVQIATDNAFNNIVATATVNTNSFSAPTLAEATTYFWRILPKNASCAGNFSATYEFQTGQVACQDYASADVPVAISASGTDSVISSIDVPDSTAISGLTVTVDIQHTWVNDLSAKLISPTGTEVNLFINPCTSDDLQDISATFADGGTTLSCGSGTPTITGTLAALSPLSVFNGEDAAGTWYLQVDDAFNQDGGAINGWSLSICSTQTLGVNPASNFDFSLSPNPNNGSFNVQFTPVSGEDITISVHDIRGRQIFGQTYATSGLFNETLQMQNAQAGMYLVTVENGNSKQVKKVIIK
ncbi:Propanediol utilization protein [Flavobacterium longum]|uniref:zinc-dependent metalloprotease n=1 Tax=Flavobacterium longum TaxID=1299340 RepID=UPI0039EB8B8A